MSYIKQNIGLVLFALKKLPLILFCRPKIKTLSESSCHIEIPLTYFTKNHVGSMYFGVLLIGVDLCCGILALDLIKKSKNKVGIIFKDVHATFIKRAKNSVRFECNKGSEIQDMIKQTIKTKERINKSINVKGFDTKTNECVVEYEIGLSLKYKPKTQISF